MAEVNTALLKIGEDGKTIENTGNNHFVPLSTMTLSSKAFALILVTVLGTYT